jgi:hypothetical protein
MVEWRLSLALNTAIECGVLGVMGDYFGTKFENLIHWEGCMGSMQCKWGKLNLTL